MATIHRSAYSVSACSSHLRIIQNTAAVNRDDMAYTSASTAENQKVSDQQYARAPTTPAPMRENACPADRVPLPPFFSMMRRPRWTIVRYRKNMVNAEQRALMMFTAMAACSGDANMVKNLAIIWNTGLPGACPTSSL